MRVYVTGIAGFIGSTVAAQLHDAGHDVAGCDDLSTGRAVNVPEGVPWDIRDVNDLKRVDADVVVHLAAQSSARHPDDALTWRVNLAATAHLLRRAKRLVFSSTCVAPNPLLGAYAGSKWAAEKLVVQRGTVLRFGNVYGPKQRDWGEEPCVMAAWQKATREGKPLRMDGDGTQTRDFIHVDDVARAVGLAVETPEADGEVLDICTGKQTAIRDVASLFDGPFVTAPRSPVDPDSMPQDPEPAADILGFRSEIDLL